jgi:branched-chain amino acid transport system ATP-binding protein
MHISSPEGSQEPPLSIEHLSAGYGRAVIVNDVSLTAASGEIAALVGPNGAGKSTLLKAVIGAIPCLTGRVLLGGEEISRLRIDQRVRRGIGYVPQTRDVFASLSVTENLEMGGYRISAKERETRIEEVFDLFPILRERRHQRADTLSGGERKMLAIARVSMTRPSVLLLDEPTANLSPKAAHELLSEHIAGVVSSGVAVLLVEQRAMEALAVSHKVFVLVAGEVAASGSPSDVGEKGGLAKLFLGAGVEAEPAQAPST